MEGTQKKSAWPIAAASILACAVIVWLAANGTSWGDSFSFRGPKGDYYNLLARGLGKGHLWMDAVVDPRLITHPDTAIRDGAPYLLDASLFNGHYYLYFGIGPVAAVYLPYSVLIGHGLSENGVGAILMLSAFGWNAATYAAARRRYFPRISGWHDFAFLSLLAFGAATPFLLLGSGFYEVAIGGGFAAMSAGWWALFQAWHSRKRAPWALAIASAAFAAAVACRPVYIFVLPAVLVVAAARIRREGRARLLLSAAILPAAVFGAALAAYNYGRFGSPLDFGFKYQVNDLMTSKLPFTQPSFFWPNLKWYYLSPPVLSPFFPFVFPIDANNRPDRYYGFELIHGQWLAGILAAGLLIVVWRTRRHLARPLVQWTALVAVVFAILLVTLCFFGFRADRYVTDFQGALVVVLAVAGGAAVAAASGRFARLTRFAIGAGAAAVALFNILAGLQLTQRYAWLGPPGLARLTYAGNTVSAAMHRLGFLQFGPVKLKVRFNPGGTNGWTPLFSTGWPQYSDLVYVAQDAEGRTVFQVFHERFGGITSGEIPMTPDEDHEIEIDLGSLYPPLDHPYYRELNPVEAQVLRSSARIAVDGKTVFGARLETYERTSNRTWLGREPNKAATFRGQVLGFTRENTQIPGRAPPVPEIGLWRLDTLIPPQPPGVYFPLLAAGAAGNGALLRARTPTDSTLEFSLDIWGSGITTGPTVPLAGGRRHLIEVVAGPQLAKLRPPRIKPEQLEALPRLADSLQIWMDDSLVWELRLPANFDVYDFAIVGANLQGFSSSQPFFPAEIRKLKVTDELVRFAVDRSAGRIKQAALRNDPGWDGFPGPVRMRLQWPENPAGTREPLIVTGVTGAADILYARWEDPQHIRLGIDHWGSAVTESAPIEIDSKRGSILEVAGTSLMPPPASAVYRSLPQLAMLRTVTIVRVDGQQVLRAQFPSHPAKPEEMSFGENRVGGSVAGQRFTGRIFEISPAPPDQALSWIRAAFLRPPAGTNPALNGFPGGVNLTVRFPAAPAPGSREILLATGVTGIGDVFFVQYEPDRRIRIGWDHWGSELTMSEPLTVDPEAELEVSFSTASLFPQPAGAGSPRPTVVRIGDRDAIRKDAATFPSAADEISVGAGVIGGSSAVAPFSGRLVEVVAANVSP